MDSIARLLGFKEMVKVNDGLSATVQKALWGILELWVEHDIEDDSNAPFYCSASHIRWESLNAELGRAIDSRFKGWEDGQKMKELDQGLLDVCLYDFTRKFLIANKNLHFSCHRDICSIIPFISRELGWQQRSPAITAIGTVREQVLYRLRVFLYGQVANNLITDQLGFSDLEGADIEGEEEDEYQNTLRINEW